MPDPTTPAKGLTLPTVGGDTGVWGTLTNSNWSLVDSFLGGTISIAITGNTILTSPQIQYTGYKFSGTVSGATTINWPAFSGFAVIQNSTSGGFSLTCGISGGGSVVVASGTTAPVWSDGLNFLQLTLFVGGAPSTGTGPNVLQNAPLIINPVVSGTVGIQGSASGAIFLTAPVSGGGIILFPPGNKTLADTVLDNVTLTGDATNTGTSISVVNLSHVTNASLPTAGMVSGYVIIGSTTINLGSTATGVSGLGALVSTSISGTTITGISLSGTTINGVSPEGTIFQSTLPFILSPSGSMAASGRVTFGTALPTIYANAYTYFPAGAIQAASAAGWYFTQCTSTVSGVVYNNTYVSGQPVIPGSLTAFSSAGPGAFTGTVTGQSAYVFQVPGNTMSTRGTLRLLAGASVPATTGLKTLTSLFGGTTFMTYAEGSSGVTSIYVSQDIANQENVSGQYSIWNATAGTSGAAIAGVGSSRGTVQTSGNQNLSIGVQMALSADFVVLEHLAAVLLKGP